MKTPFIATLGILLCFLATVTSLAQDEKNDPRAVREWTSSAGSSLKASWDGMEGSTVLLKQGDRIRRVPLSKLSPADQEFVKTHRTAIEEGGKNSPPVDLEGVTVTPGEISEEIKCKRKSEWSYYLYLPKRFDKTRDWPVLFVMDPGGGRAKTLARYEAGAERCGMVLAVSKQCRNSFEQASEAMLSMVNDVRDRLPVSKNLTFASGHSGGARMAFSLAAEEGRNCAGVLACAAGASSTKGKINRKTTVYSLVGTNDFNRWDVVLTHERYSDKTNKMRWFPGNHDWAGQKLIADGMAYLYGVALKNATSPDEAECHRFADSVWKSFVDESDRGRQYEWCLFLKDFPCPPGLRKSVNEMHDQLSKDTVANLHIEGEAELDRFARKYYSDNIDSYKTDEGDPRRERAALSLMERYNTTSWKDVFKRIGEPCKKP